MKNVFSKVNRILTTGAVLSVAVVFNAPASKAASLTPQLIIQESLFFGRNILGKGEVSESQFQGFINNTVTSRFPDGLTIFDANGQFRDSSGIVIREKSKNLTLFTEDNPRNTTAINDIARTYIQNFNQESVLRVTNKDNLKVSFGQNEDLFSNSSIPKFIKVDLFFGRNIPGGEVSEEQFQGFINDTITPRFPDGLTVFDANGQFRDSKGTVIREKSKNVSLLLEDTPKNETSINEVVRRYVQQFNQESVLQVANEKVKVSFGLGDDLFDNSPNPKSIKVDLFFGRNIPGGGEVSEDQFQGFLNNVITPRFPDGLTIFDVNGQFRDSTGTIIKEKSKNVSLLLEDSFKNETSINEVVRAYVQQFRQQSVLQVADENVEVSFISSKRPISVPEPSLTVSLLTLGVLGTSSAFKKKKKFTAKKLRKIR